MPHVAAFPRRYSRGRPSVFDAQVRFEGGLNTTADDLQMGVNEVRRADNCRLTQVGNLAKRLGLRRLHASALGAPSTVRGLYSWRPVSSQTLLAVANGTLYTGTYGTAMSWTSQGGSFTAANAVDMKAFRTTGKDLVFLADGGLLNSWDGTTLTMRIASTPSVQWLAVYNQRLFGISGQDQTLYWSALNDGTTLGFSGSAGGSDIVRAFNEQAITGLAALRSSLLLFHVTGISVFTGLTQDDINIAAGTAGLTQDTGTIASRSVVVAENAAYFLSDRGFYMATAQGVQPISQKIDATVQTWDASQYANVTAVHNRAQREIWWYIPTVGVMVYNYFLSAWAGPFTGGYTSPVTSVFADAINSTAQPIVLRGDASGWVSQGDYPNALTDNITSAGAAGSNFTMVVKARRMYFGDPTQQCAFRYWYLQAQLGGATATSLGWTGLGGTYTTALPASTGGKWGTGTWGSGVWGTQAEKSYRLDASDRGYFVDLTFTESSQSTCLLSALQAEATPLGRRY